MIRRVAIALLLLAAPLPACADEPAILAESRAVAGSLLPEYAWETSVTIFTSGHLALEKCRGHETEGFACTTPARQGDDVPVGGGSAGEAVHLHLTRIALPSFPIAADASRVGAVLALIPAAVPTRFDRFFASE